MAFPVVETTAETAVSTASTSHPITLPASIAAGDLLVLVLAKGSAVATINAHADWTELLDENTAAGLYIAYRWATGGEGATTTLVSSASTRSATIVYRISGAENPATQAPQIGTTSTGSSTTADPPAVTPTGGAKDYLWIACLARNGEEADDDTWATAAPANFTGLLQKACGVAGTNLAGIVAAAQRSVNASSQDPGAFTIATGGWRAQTIAVHPRGAQTFFGSSTLTANVSVTTSGTRKTFSSSSLGITFAAVSSGARKAFGSSSLTLTVGVVSAGSAVARGSSSLTASVGITTVGRLGARGASSLTLNVATVSSGTRSTFGSSSLAVNVAITSSGTRTTFGSSSLPISVATDSAGLLGAFGSSTLTLDVSITSNGTVSGAGPQTYFGSSSLALTVASTTSGSRTTFGASTLPLTATLASAGTRETFSTSALGIVVTITTDITVSEAVITSGVSFGQILGPVTGKVDS